MEIISLIPNDFASNCYIVYSGEEAYLFDSSAASADIKAELEKHGLRLKGIILTHGHFDHVLSADEVRRELGAPLYIHENDAEMLSDSHKNGYSSFFYDDFKVRDADKTFSDGDVFTLGDEKIKVIHTPGHTRGSCCFDLGDKLITGDTLFASGFGRYDLWGGDRETLFKSLEGLSRLEDKQIYAGHGERAMLSAALKRIQRYL